MENLKAILGKVVLDGYINTGSMPYLSWAYNYLA